MERFLRPAPPDGDPSTSDRAASTRPKRPLPPGTQTTLRDCAKVVVLDRRDDPATAAAALLPTLTDPAAPPAAQLDALRRLACLRFVDRGLLAGTGVGAAVRRLKRSDDVEVGQVREGRGGAEGAARAHRGRGGLTFLSLSSPSSHSPPPAWWRSGRPWSWTSWPRPGGRWRAGRERGGEGGG